MGPNAGAARETTSQPASRPQPQSPAAGRPAAAAPIQFVCASCRKTLRVPAASAGKKGKCPHCNAVMTIPAQSAAAKQPASQKWKGAPQPAAAPIQFTCPGCQKSVRVKAAAAGQQGQCPHCKSVVKIPHKSAPPPPSTSGLTPLGGLDGLTPLPDDGGLTPLPDSAAGTPGLTPLAASDPLGSTADPFAGLTEVSASSGFGSQDPFGGAASAPGPVNPYASPAPSASYAQRSSPTRSKGSRKGLPWDNKRRHDAPFWGTVKLVFFSPVEAFVAMRRSGGDAPPLLFCVYGTMIGGAFAVLYRLGMDAIVTLPMLASGDGAEGSARMAGMVVGMIIGVIVGYGFLILATVISSYIMAGMVHLGLMVLGGANYGFQTTARVVHYTWGATSLAGMIPCVGPLIQFFANVVILSIGMSNAHETSGVKATFAVLIPFLVCIGAFTALFFAGIAWIASMAN